MPTIADVLSPSQCSAYLGCSARWHYRYVKRLPDPASGSLVRGRAVHRLASYWFGAKIQGHTPDDAELGEAYDEIWDQCADGAAFGVNEDVDELKDSGEMLAAKYLAEAAPEIEPAAVDVPVSGEIGGVPVRGFIDLIDTSGRIIDLKTAKAKPSCVSPDYALQVATYAQLAPSLPGDVRIDTIVDTKSPQIVTIPYTVSEADRTMTERIYPRVQALMQSGAVSPNRSNKLCSRKYCAFADICCEEWGGHVS